MYASSLARTETKPTSGSQSISPAKILVADDEPEVGEIIELMLCQCGHQVTVVNGGQEALDAFFSEDYDLVITDVYMPEVSGHEVAKVVKKSTAGVPVLLITGWALQIDMSELGVDGIIAKPFTKETLSHHVIEALGDRSNG
jgi:CheY-like chemotaxis protein